MRDLLSELPALAGKGFSGPELIVDCFAGGGGASTGIFLALGRHPDIAVNHDPEALAMHRANHPETLHVSKNIYKVDPMDLCHNRPVGLLWASPDCKHFSKAKGARPVKRNVRDLAWTVIVWLRRARPRVVILENVEEFLDYGPLIPAGEGKYRPCPDRKGETFKLWVSSARRQGYKVEWKVIHARNHRTPTIRKRLYVIMRRDGMPIVWPEEVTAPISDPDVIDGKKTPEKTAAGIIDWSLPCPSIFDTSEEIFEKHGVRAKRPLAENTLKRIARGVQRYVLEAKRPFIVVCNHGGDWFRGQGIDEPLQTLTASRDGFGIIQPFVSYAQHGGGNRSVEDPLHTVTASAKDQNCIAAAYLKRDFGQSTGQSIDLPAPTVTASGEGKSGVVAAFMAQHNNDSRRLGGVNPGRPVTLPLSTLTAAPQQGLVMANMLSLRGSDRRDYSVDDPVRTLSAGGNHEAVATCYLDRQFTRSTGSDLNEPCPTITAGGDGKANLVAAFLDAYYGTDQALSLNEPMGSDTTRDRRSLVTVEIDGKTFVIVDIGMRMLTPRERFNAQGFPPDYIIDHGIDEDGNKIALSQSAQGRMCGNSVCPPVAEALVLANVPELAVQEVAA